jgi:hypothetical protein
MDHVGNVGLAASRLPALSPSSAETSLWKTFMLNPALNHNLMVMLLLPFCKAKVHAICFFKLCASSFHRLGNLSTGRTVAWDMVVVSEINRLEVHVLPQFWRRPTKCVCPQPYQLLVGMAM